MLILKGGVVGSLRPTDAIGGREAPTTVGSLLDVAIKPKTDGNEVIVSCFSIVVMY